jgi:hypothetical protein
MININYTFDKPSQIQIENDNSVLVLSNNTIIRCKKNDSKILFNAKSLFTISSKCGDLFFCSANPGCVVKKCGKTGETSVIIKGLHNPIGLIVDNNVNLYVCDMLDHTIFKYFKKTNYKTRIRFGRKGGFKNGSNAICKFNYPSAMVMIGNGNILVSDSWNHCIREINTKTNTISTLCGSNVYNDFNDGIFETSLFNNITDIKLCSDGTVIIVDSGNCRIRHINLHTRMVSSLYHNTKCIFESLDIANNGDILVSDSRNSNITRLSNNGIIISKYDLQKFVSLSLYKFTNISQCLLRQVLTIFL